MQVLVAEDDEVQRDLLTDMLTAHDHQVTAVSNGALAWQTLQNCPISMVFTDWIMPQLNGLELIQRIREDVLGRYVYIILCTGKNSKHDLVQGMRAGADDFLTKPFQEDEFMARMSSGERVLALESRLEQENRNLEQEKQKLAVAYDTIRRDLESAARMQRSLLPASTRIGGVRFESLFSPASMVAGDIFNFFPLSENKIGFYQLDVSGHGIPAAMLSVTLSKILSPGPVGSSLLKHKLDRAPWHEVVPPNDALSELNRRFQDNGDLYFTMLYGVIHQGDPNHLYLAQAGHPHPILLASGAKPMPVGGGGFPLGVLPQMDYELYEIQVGKKDRLFVTSDGVLECTNLAGEQFGSIRLMDFVKQNEKLSLRELLDQLLERLQHWRQSDEFDDDISVMALEFP